MLPHIHACRGSDLLVNGKVHAVVLVLILIVRETTYQEITNLSISIALTFGGQITSRLYSAMNTPFLH